MYTYIYIYMYSNWGVYRSPSSFSIVCLSIVHCTYVNLGQVVQAKQLFLLYWHLNFFLLGAFFLLSFPSPLSRTNLGFFAPCPSYSLLHTIYYYSKRKKKRRKKKHAFKHHQRIATSVYSFPVFALMGSTATGQILTRPR